MTGRNVLELGLTSSERGLTCIQEPKDQGANEYWAHDGVRERKEAGSFL